VTRTRSTIQAGASQVCGKVWQGSLGYGAPWLLIGSFQMTREASRIIKKRTVQGQLERFLDPHRAPELSGTFDPPLASSTLVFLGGECSISRLDRGSVPVGRLPPTALRPRQRRVALRRRGHRGTARVAAVNGAAAATPPAAAAPAAAAGRELRAGESAGGSTRGRYRGRKRQQRVRRPSATRSGPSRLPQGRASTPPAPCFAARRARCLPAATIDGVFIAGRLSKWVSLCPCESLFFEFRCFPG